MKKFSMIDKVKENKNIREMEEIKPTKMKSDFQ